MQDRDNLLSRRTQRTSSDAASVARYYMQNPPGFSSEFSPVLWEGVGEKVWEGGRGREGVGGRAWEGGCGMVNLGYEAEVYVLQHQLATNTNLLPCKDCDVDTMVYCR